MRRSFKQASTCSSLWLLSVGSQLDEHAAAVLNVLLALHGLDPEFQFTVDVASMLRHLMIQLEVPAPRAKHRSSGCAQYEEIAFWVAVSVMDLYGVRRASLTKVRPAAD